MKALFNFLNDPLIISIYVFCEDSLFLVIIDYIYFLFFDITMFN